MVEAICVEIALKFIIEKIINKNIERNNMINEELKMVKSEIINNEFEKCTIYILRNKVNDKIYIGQTWNVMEDRMGKDGGKYSNSAYLYNAIQKHGVENFYYEMLAECTTQEEADKLESEYIIKYNSKNGEIGYNLKDGGRGGKHSEETKAKISKTLKMKAEQWTPEERAKRTEAISGWWEGKQRGPHTEEWKDANSKFMIERHKTQGHPMQGKHHTEEVKLQLSIANTGRKMPKESVERGAEKRRMNPEKEQLIVKAYQDGESILNIREIFKTGNASIYRILERNNIALKNNKNDENK